MVKQFFYINHHHIDAHPLWIQITMRGWHRQEVPILHSFILLFLFPIITDFYILWNPFLHMCRLGSNSYCTGLVPIHIVLAWYNSYCAGWVSINIVQAEYQLILCRLGNHIVQDGYQFILCQVDTISYYESMYSS